jgi:hypothetical protein
VLALCIHGQFAGRVPPNSLDALIIAAKELDRAYWTDFEASRNFQQLKEMEKAKSSIEVRSSTVNLKTKKQRFANTPTSLTTPATSTLTDTRPKSNFSNTAKPTYKKHLGPC